MRKVISLNPHDGSILEVFASASDMDIADACSAARAAFKGWNKTSITHRICAIKEFRTYIEDNREQIASWMALETGRPRLHCLLDVDTDLKYLRFYIANASTAFAGEELGSSVDGITYDRMRRPHGVVACILPWNFPLASIVASVVPALVAGNTVIVKPSEKATMCQSRLVEALRRHLPDGVLHTVIGGADQGRTVVASDVDFVWFTGSTAAGREVYRDCGMRLRPAVCELGGSSPAIIFEDCDMRNAVENLFLARFNNAGQVCKAVKRLYVESSIVDEFVDRLICRISSITVGNPMSDVGMGPLIGQDAAQLVREQVEDSMTGGGEVLAPECKYDPAETQLGSYVMPMLLMGVKLDSRVMREEVFGPVLPIVVFSDIREAIELANASAYGLSAEIYTCDEDKATVLIEELEVGAVAVNTDRYYGPQWPVAGYKMSGIGTKHGIAGMQEFTRTQLIARTLLAPV